MRWTPLVLGALAVAAAIGALGPWSSGMERILWSDPQPFHDAGTDGPGWVIVALAAIALGAGFLPRGADVTRAVAFALMTFLVLLLGSNGASSDTSLFTSRHDVRYEWGFVLLAAATTLGLFGSAAYALRDLARARLERLPREPVSKRLRWILVAAALACAVAALGPWATTSWSGPGIPYESSSTWGLEFPPGAIAALVAVSIALLAARLRAPEGLSVLAFVGLAVLAGVGIVWALGHQPPAPAGVSFERRGPDWGAVALFVASVCGLAFAAAARFPMRVVRPAPARL